MQETSFRLSVGKTKFHSWTMFAILASFYHGVSACCLTRFLTMPNQNQNNNALNANYLAANNYDGWAAIKAEREEEVELSR